MMTKPVSVSQCNAIFSLFLCALLWSTGGILIKLVKWNPFAIAGARSFIGAVTMLCVLRRIPRRFDRNQVIGAAAYSLTMILDVTATKMTTAANAIFLQYTNPIYVIILGRFLLDEKTDWIDAVTVAGVLGGMALFLGGGLNFSGNAGIAAAVCSGAAFGVSVVFFRRQKDGNPADSFILSHVITFAVTLPFWFGSAPPDMKSVGGLFLLGIIQMGLPSILYAKGITRVTAISSVLITMLEPVMNPVWVLLFYGEKPAGRTVAGGAVILSFIFFRVFLKNRIQNLH